MKETAAQRKQRIQKLLANPGTRASVPDKDLPAALLKKRLQNRSLDEPVVAGSDVTRRQLARQREAAVNLQFGDAERSLQAQQPRDASWYDQYLQQIRDIQTRQQAQAGQAAQQVQSFANAAQGLSQQQAAQQMQQMQQDAGQRGAQVDPKLAEIAANAAKVRGGYTASFGGNLATQNAAQGDFLRSQELAGGQGKLQHLKDLASQLASVETKKGEYRTQFEQDATDKIRKQLLEDAAFGLDTKKAADTAKAGRASRREQRRHNQAVEKTTSSTGYGPGRPGLNKYGRTYDEWTGMTEAARAKARAGKDKKAAASEDWQTPGEQQGFWKNVSKVYGVATTLKTEGEKDDTGKVVHPPYASRAELIARLRQDPKYPGDLVAAAALDHVFGPGLTAATVRNLHKNKIQVATGGRWGKRVPTTTSATNTTHGN